MILRRKKGPRYDKRHDIMSSQNEGVRLNIEKHDHEMFTVLTSNAISLSLYYARCYQQKLFLRVNRHFSK